MRHVGGRPQVHHLKGFEALSAKDQQQARSSRSVIIYLIGDKFSEVIIYLTIFFISD